MAAGNSVSSKRKVSPEVLRGAVGTEEQGGMGEEGRLRERKRREERRGEREGEEEGEGL